MSKTKRHHIFGAKDKVHYNHSDSYEEGYTIKRMPHTDLMVGVLIGLENNNRIL